MLVLKSTKEKTFEQIQYTGKISFEKVKEFLNKFALEQRSIRPEDRPKLEAEFPVSKDIDNENFEENVINNDNYAFVHFFEEEAHPAYNQTKSYFL